MPHPPIGQHRRGVTGGAKPRGKPGGIAGLDEPVVAARHQQRRRHAGRNMEDRLRLRPFGAAKNHFQYFVPQRHEIVRPGDADQADNIATGRQAHLVQPAPIDRQHRGDVGAGRVALQKDFVGIAAEACRVVLDPAHGKRRILDEIGITGFRIDAIVGYDRDMAAAGQRLGHVAIEPLVTAALAAAIEEHDDGRGDGVDGPTNVQRVPRTLGVGDRTRDLDGTPHAGGSKNSIGPNEGDTEEVVRRDEDNFPRSFPPD